MEVELREQFLIDERIKAYRQFIDQNRAEQMAVVQKITAAAAEEDKKRQDEKLKKINEEKAAQEVVLKADQKR